MKSMTGYGRAELTDGNKKVAVEIRSVNHRYLDLSVKVPRKLNFLEPEVRNILKKYIERGKVDVLVSYEELEENPQNLQYNQAMAGEYLRYFTEMQKSFGLENDVRVSTLSRCPEVFTIGEEPLDEEGWSALLEKAARSACEQLLEARSSEGEKLGADLLEKLDHMEENVNKIEARAPQILSEYRKRLEEKVQEILSEQPVDENRIATEIVLYADKICTDEETVRLKSHIQSMRDTLKKKESIGRKLDFIAQEMNRESNTILSKANDLETTNIAIDLKTEIEKVREQIQNIE